MNAEQNALPRFRLELLLLLPNGVRLAVDVDGRYHYGDDDGNGGIYAILIAADRELTSGHHVFGSGRSTPHQSKAESVVKGFFTASFRKHGLLV